MKCNPIGQLGTNREQESGSAEGVGLSFVRNFFEPFDLVDNLFDGVADIGGLHLLAGVAVRVCVEKRNEGRGIVDVFLDGGCANLALVDRVARGQKNRVTRHDVVEHGGGDCVKDYRKHEWVDTSQ